jgi:hypothetical protein
MQEEDSIKSVIEQFAKSFDDKDWQGMAPLLTEEIYLDYSSFRNTPPVMIYREEYIEMREEALRELMTSHAYTHLDVALMDGQAICRCDYAIQRFTLNKAKHLHTYGHYVFNLRKERKQWQICGITQHVLRHDGDQSIRQ